MVKSAHLPSELKKGEEMNNKQAEALGQQLGTKTARSLIASIKSAHGGNLTTKAFRDRVDSVIRADWSSVADALWGIQVCRADFTCAFCQTLHNYLNEAVKSAERRAGRSKKR